MRDAISPGLVSAIIPVFNAEAFVGQAIDSVLAQDYMPIEIVVVDDGSTDGTAAMVAAFGDAVKLVRQEHLGIGATRNRGVAESRGEFIAFLDADDLWLPAKTQHQVKLISEDGLDGAFGGIETFYESEEARRFEVRDAGAGGAGFHAGALLARRESFLKVGMFETRWRVGEFIDWFARAEVAGLRFGSVDEVVLRRRIHGRNTSITSSARADFLAIARENLARRRQAGAG